jgi:predicted Zn finger-like uncharacterized protein
MLITTCTHCVARFKVTPQQLNAKQGQVRCGKCGRVFSGFEALERFPDDDTGARLLAAREAADRAGEPRLESIQPPPIEDLPIEDLPDVETLDSPPPLPPPSAYVEEPSKPSTSPPAPRRGARRPTIEYEETDPPPRHVSRAWSFGVALLALVFAAELAYAYRGPIAQRYPVLRPWLESACAHAHCTIPWMRDDRLLKLEDSELLEVPGRPTEIALGARVRNLATAAQEYPHLELTLTDLTGQAAARRVLRPIDYVGRALGPGEVLAPGAEVAIQLRLETPRIKATGYELLLFYP